jgi:hypothetical protein
MALGFLLIGVVFGLVAAIVTFASGFGVLMALLAYSGIGSLGVVLAALVSLLPKPSPYPIHS